MLRTFPRQVPGGAPGRAQATWIDLLNPTREEEAAVEKQFRLATREIEKEISIWYKRLEANNDISMADAKALLAGKDLQEFHWSVEEYIARGQEYGISGKWAKELENASARVHITQLDALKLKMQQQLEVLYGNQVDGLDRQLKDIYSEGFYKTAYEVYKGIGVGSQLRQLSPERRPAAETFYLTGCYASEMFRPGTRRRS